MATEETAVDNIVDSPVEQPVDSPVENPEQPVDNPVEQPPDKPAKTKNPKRIEQGRKLAEWNKKNKQRVKPVATPVSTPAPAATPTDYLFNYWQYAVGAVLLGLVYFQSRSEAPMQAPMRAPMQVQTPPTPDPFAMD